jgi:hypothetical protein
MAKQGRRRDRTRRSRARRDSPPSSSADVPPAPLPLLPLSPRLSRVAAVVLETFGETAPALRGGKPVGMMRVLTVPKHLWAARPETEPADEQLYAVALAWARWRFDQYGDPLAAWQVYCVSRTLRRSIPEWVGAYLDQAAQQILRSEDADVEAALGFKRLGAGTVGARIARARQHEELAFAVLAHVRTGTQVKEALYNVAQARSVSYSTVERAWESLPANLRKGQTSGKDPLS